jgi:hypothetical protein
MTRLCGAELDAGGRGVFERSRSWIVGECKLVIGKRCCSSCNKAI